MKISHFIVPIVCLIFSAVYLLEIFKIAEPSVGDILGPRFLPFVLVSFFSFLAILLFASEIIDRKKYSSPRDNRGPALKQAYSIIGTFVMLVLYIVIIDYCGYVLTTFLFVFFFLTFFTKRGLLANVLYSGMIVGGFYLVFDFWLRIPFPSFALWR